MNPTVSKLEPASRNISHQPFPFGSLRNQAWEGKGFAQGQPGELVGGLGTESGILTPGKRRSTEIVRVLSICLALSEPQFPQL